MSNSSAKRLINHGVLFHRARQWDMEEKAPHTIILAKDEGNGHYEIWKVYNRGKSPSIFWIIGCASCRAGQAVTAEKFLPTLGME
jgi:hypothetical protein